MCVTSSHAHYARALIGMHHDVLHLIVTGFGLDVARARHHMLAILHLLVVYM